MNKQTQQSPSEDEVEVSPPGRPPIIPNSIAKLMIEIEANKQPARIPAGAFDAPKRSRTVLDICMDLAREGIGGE